MILFAVITESEKEEISRLIFSISRGDEAALISLYKKAGGRLLSVAMGITRSLQLAEDALSESFIKLIKHADQFKGGSGYAWLCTIVKNTALNIIKSDQRKRGEDIDSFFHLTDGRDFAEHAANALAVEDALKKLNKEERLCIWLKYFNDYTVRQIAEETKLSKSTAHDIIKKAEQKLCQYIKSPE